MQPMMRNCDDQIPLKKWGAGLKIGFVNLQIFFIICMQQACNDAHKLTLF